MNRILNTTVNTRNATIGVIIVIITTLLADQGIVDLIRTQPWGPVVITLLPFIAGLLTKFYLHDAPTEEVPPTEPE